MTAFGSYNGPMKSWRRTLLNRPLGLLIAWALLWASVAPVVSLAADRQAGSSQWAEICTAHGITWVQLQPDGTVGPAGAGGIEGALGSTPEGASGHLFEHCPGCVPSAHAPAIAMLQSGSLMPRPASQALPDHRSGPHGPQPLSGWPVAARAPPSQLAQPAQPAPLVPLMPLMPLVPLPHQAP